jgi:hypothetical protein
MIVVQEDRPGLAGAVLLAFRAGDYEPDDVLAVLDILRTGASLLPVTSEAEAVEVMAGWLAAAKRLRLLGQPVTIQALAWQAHRGTNEAAAVAARSAVMNHEAQEAARELGVEPPPTPVRPPRRKS